MTDTHSSLDRRRHRARAARQKLISATNRALALLEHEDPASPVTASYDPGGSSSGDSPVEGQALATLEHGTDPRRHLDRIVSGLEKHATALDGFVEDLAATRTPTVPCWCCHDELATHTRRIHGQPVELCAACHDFHRNNDTLCGEETHRHRPKVRWCDCPLECCPAGCPDRAAEGRRISERCKSRMRRRNLELTTDEEVDDG